MYSALYEADHCTKLTTVQAAAPGWKNLERDPRAPEAIVHIKESSGLEWDVDLPLSSNLLSGKLQSDHNHTLTWRSIWTSEFQKCWQQDPLFKHIQFHLSKASRAIRGEAGGHQGPPCFPQTWEEAVPPPPQLTHRCYSEVSDWPLLAAGPARSKFGLKLM